MYLMVPFFGTTVTAMMKVAEEVSRKVMGLITLTWKIGILPTNVVVPIYHILVPLVKGTTRNWISHRNLNKIPNRSFEANWYQVYLHWPNGYHFGYQTCHGTIWLGGTQKHLKAPQIITSNEYLTWKGVPCQWYTEQNWNGITNNNLMDNKYQNDFGTTWKGRATKIGYHFSVPYIPQVWGVYEA